MMFIFPAELEVLRIMQPVDRDVFYYLAERMDYVTGLIGKERKVSYGGIAYDLTEHDGERRVKSSLQILNARYVRTVVIRLINAGLFLSLSEKGKNKNLILVRVFFADFMGLGYSVQKTEGNHCASKIDFALTILYNRINEIKNGNKKIDEEKIRPEGKTFFSYLNNNAGPMDEKPFSMTPEWQPSQPELTIFLERSGKFTMDDIDIEWINGFVRHWWQEGKRQYTQKGWTAKLAAKLIFYLRTPGIYEKLNGIKKPINNKVVNINSVRTSSLPEWARVPKDDEGLVEWMRKHKYGDPPVGYSNSKSRMWLQTQVERKLKEWNLEREKNQS